MIKFRPSLSLPNLREFITDDPPSDLVHRLAKFSNFRPKHSPIMGSTYSHQPVSAIETNNPFIFPQELIRKIAHFLDAKEFFSTVPLICTFALNLYKKTVFYENYTFFGSRNIHFISQLYSVSQNAQEPRYFRPNVVLPLEGEIKQPTEIRINIFTISDSEKIHLGEISSMFINLFIMGDRYLEAQILASDFLNKLCKGSRFERLGNLQLSGLLVNSPLLGSLSNLHLNWLYLAPPFMDDDNFNRGSFPGYKKLHLDLRSFGLAKFPRFPPLLEELSLHFSTVETIDPFVRLNDCKHLKKM